MRSPYSTQWTPNKKSLQPLLQKIIIMFAPWLTLTLVWPCRALAVCMAEMADSCKEAKYAILQTHYDFQPIAIETLVLSMSRTFLFCTIYVGKFRSWAGRTESLGFCFNAFHSPSSALTRCFCTTVFTRATWYMLRQRGWLGVCHTPVLYQNG